jgi:hypothetical protein
MIQVSSHQDAFLNLSCLQKEKKSKCFQRSIKFEWLENTLKERNTNVLFFFTEPQLCYLKNGKKVFTFLK